MLYSEDITMESINLVGGFTGDKEVWDEVLWCIANLEKLTSDEKTFTRFMQLCDRLPSLHTFAAKVLSQGPDSLLERIMDECLIESCMDTNGEDTLDNDTDFVLLANEGAQTLNTERSHLFDIIVTLLGTVKPETAIHVAKKYLRSSSTRFRFAVLTKLVTIPEFTDNELFQAYQKAPEGIRLAIINACYKTNHRQGFFELLNDPQLIFFCSSDCVKQSLSDMFSKQRKLEKWKQHRVVYFEFFNQKFVACKGNVLEQGKVWRNICSILPRSMEDDDITALWKFLKDFQPCYLNRKLPPHVSSHLEGLAKQLDAESMMRYKDVCRYCQSWEQMRLLSTETCCCFLESSIVEGDWELFQTVPQSWYGKNFLRRKSQFRPLEYIFNQATADDLWNYIAKAESENLVFLYCLQQDHLSLLIGKYGLSAEAFWAFSDLHMKSPPQEIKDWSRWFLNYHNNSWKKHMSQVTQKIVAAALNTRPIPRSRITLYARFVHEMLNATCRIIDTASTDFIPEESTTILATLKTYYDVLYSHYNNFSRRPPVVAALLETLDKVLLQAILPRLEALLCFEPSFHETYIEKNKDHLALSASWYQLVFNAKPSEKILEACLDSLETIVKKAQANKAHELLPNGRSRFLEIVSDGKVEFVLYDTSLHQRAVKQILGHMESIVKVSDNKNLQERIMAILTFQNYFQDNLVGYLDFCRRLNPSLQAKEQVNITQLSREYLTKMHRRSHPGVVSRLAQLDMIEESLEDNLFTETLCNEYILNYAGFGHVIVRDWLKQSTRARESSDRVNAHIKWLQSALDCNELKYIEEALCFTCTRIKNEGGHVRPIIYNWLLDHINQIVVCCMNGNASASSLSMASQLSGLCVSDLDRRDSCGKGVFKEMSKIIASSVLEFDNKKQVIEVRKIWVSCALELHWKIQQATLGEKEMLFYNWPFKDGFQLPSSTWISSASFDAVYPLPKNAASIGNLSERLNLLKAIQNGDMSTYFGPKEAVDVFVTSLKTFWKEEYPCSLFQLTNGILKSATTNRLIPLFSLCNIAWQEVPFLASIFDDIFSSSLRTAVEEHLQSAGNLLKAIINIHGDSFHEILRVRNACELFFTCVVSTWQGSESQKKLARFWLPVLLGMKMKSNLRNFNLSAGADARLLPFLSRHCNGCEPSSCSIYKVPATRTAETASYILGITKSAFWVPEVRDMFFKVRPDMFTYYLELDDPLDGPFSPSSNEHNESRMTLLKAEMIGHLPVRISKAYADRCLETVKDSAFSILQRTGAIEDIMNAPSTSHQDVLKLLELDLDESLLEALIVKIFSIDSPWHVLAAMFTAESISKRPQRMTASLLGHIQKHIQVDTVVKALHFLLEDPRRKSLKVQLHKAIVRLLFDSKTKIATQCLRNEWIRTDLHKDVRYLIVELCVAAVLSQDESKDTSWECSVLTEVAEDASTDAETAVLLFTPIWDRSIINVSQQLHQYFGHDCKEETMRVFLDKWPNRVPISNEKTVRVFAEIFGKLEENTPDSVIRTLAKCQRFAFSELFANKPLDKHGILSEIRAYLFNKEDAVCQWDDLTRLFVESVTDIFLDGSLACLIESIAAQQTDRSGKVHDEVWKQVSDKDIAAKHVRELVQHLLDELVNLPMIKTAERRKIQTALGRISNHLPSRKIFITKMIGLFSNAYGYYFVSSIQDKFRHMLIGETWAPYSDMLSTDKTYADQLFT